MVQQKSSIGGNQQRRVTIRDVAEAAGVSISTVSHVLNDYGDIGPPETVLLVRKTMQQLNYYPQCLGQKTD